MELLERIRSLWKSLYRLSPGEEAELLQRILQTNAQQELVSSPRRNGRRRGWWAVAAGVVVAVGIGGYMHMQAEASAPAADKRGAGEFAQLIVPDGNQTTLVLEDGSEVWVNAGSRLVYPLTFAADRREIYLDGEIYIHVTPDKQRPFTVKTDRMDVRVHGTSFNVCAYEKDATQEVVLVQGSVSIKSDGKERQLSPNQLFACTTRGNSVKQVNADDYTLWRYGLYRFNHARLSSILERLGRNYGKIITYDSRVDSLTFSGKLDMHEPLETLLDGLCYAAPISFVAKGDTAYFIGLK